ncbi:hypothetical protein DFH07DRAFT_830807 [Mycena maculata]|uniref:Methyltransferase n=1 Tax=Mycena maculata TaxID=230809 RepID=A0AAD7IS01_9AGAR|nr:hypothetical protein DFH07DRAFT_830807 [Mycena maculata]
MFALDPRSTYIMDATKNDPATEASVMYYLPPADGARPYKNINDRHDHNYISDWQKVTIENIRGKEDSAILDFAGFQYYTRPSRLKDFSNAEDVLHVYYPETVELIKEFTGASKVILFDHTIRRHRPDDHEESPDKRQPVYNVHCDQTPKSAVARVYRHLPEDEAHELLKYRFQILNLWRPISHAAYDWPLGFCDSSSLNPETDLMAMTLKFPGGPGETYGIKYNPNHRWRYLRGMEPEECVLFKCFDSTDDPNITTFNAHTGFSDPTTPEGAPYRESIEMRALVFYL